MNGNIEPTDFVSICAKLHFSSSTPKVFATGVEDATRSMAFTRSLYAVRPTFVRSRFSALRIPAVKDVML